MKKLRHILIDRDVQQKELAAYAGCSEAYLSECMHGRKDPSLRVLRKIAEFLELSIDDILDA